MENDKETTEDDRLKALAIGGFVCAFSGLMSLFCRSTWIFAIVFSIMGLLLSLDGLGEKYKDLSLLGVVASLGNIVTSSCLLTIIGFLPAYV